MGQTNYGAAKAGIAAMTLIAADELARYGVTANVIAPGALTRMTEDLGIWEGDRAAAMDPRWIAPIVTWLASTESSGVTGRVIESSGTFTAIAEGWVRGPATKTPPAEPADAGKVLTELLAAAHGRTGMDGATRT